MLAQEHAARERELEEGVGVEEQHGEETKVVLDMDEEKVDQQRRTREVDNDAEEEDTVDPQRSRTKIGDDNDVEEEEGRPSGATHAREANEPGLDVQPTDTEPDWEGRGLFLGDNGRKPFMLAAADGGTGADPAVVDRQGAEVQTRTDLHRPVSERPESCFGEQKNKENIGESPEASALATKEEGVRADLDKPSGEAEVADDQSRCVCPEWVDDGPDQSVDAAPVLLAQKPTHSPTDHHLVEEPPPATVALVALEGETEFSRAEKQHDKFVQLTSELPLGCRPACCPLAAVEREDTVQAEPVADTTALTEATLAGGASVASLAEATLVAAAADSALPEPTQAGMGCDGGMRSGVHDTGTDHAESTVMHAALAAHDEESAVKDTALVDGLMEPMKPGHDAGHNSAGQEPAASNRVYTVQDHPAKLDFQERAAQLRGSKRWLMLEDSESSTGGLSLQQNTPTVHKTEEGVAKPGSEHVLPNVVAHPIAPDRSSQLDAVHPVTSEGMRASEQDAVQLTGIASEELGGLDADHPISAAGATKGGLSTGGQDTEYPIAIAGAAEGLSVIKECAEASELAEHHVGGELLGSGSASEASDVAVSVACMSNLQSSCEGGDPSSPVHTKAITAGDGDSEACDNPSVPSRIDRLGILEEELPPSTVEDEPPPKQDEPPPKENELCTSEEGLPRPCTSEEGLPPSLTPKNDSLTLLHEEAVIEVEHMERAAVGGGPGELGAIVEEDSGQGARARSELQRVADSEAAAVGPFPLHSPGQTRAVAEADSEHAALHTHWAIEEEAPDD